MRRMEGENGTCLVRRREEDFVKKRREEDFGVNGTCDLHIQYLLLIEKERSNLQLMHTYGQTYNFADTCF